MGGDEEEGDQYPGAISCLFTLTQTLSRQGRGVLGAFYDSSPLGLIHLCLFYYGLVNK